MTTLKLMALTFVFGVAIAISGSINAFSSEIASNNGACEPGETYDPACDVNRDGSTNVEDLSLVADHWGDEGIWTGDVSGDYWSLTGNAGTDPSTNFLGTTDSQDLVIRTDNAERMRVTSKDGNVGIGTTEPDANVSISAQLPDDAFRVRSDNITTFIIDEDGQTGIGTSQPKAQLQVNSASGEDALLVQTHASLTPRLLVDTNGNVGIGADTLTDKLTVFNTDMGRAGFFETDNPANITAALSTVTNGRGSALFANIFNRESTSPTLHAIHQGSGVAGRFEGQISVQRNNHQIEVQDTDNSSKSWTITSHQATSGIGFWEDGQTGRLMVAAGGNVGIGTIDPETPLDIQGTAGTDIRVTDGEFSRMRMVATDPAEDVTLSIQARGSNGTSRAEIGTLSEHDMVFYANGSIRLRIESDGAVCIGNC